MLFLLVSATYICKGYLEMCLLSWAHCHSQQNQSQQRKEGDNKDKQQPQGGMSQDNIDQILKTMQNQENAIQQKVNAQKAREKNAGRRKTGNQW